MPSASAATEQEFWSYFGDRASDTEAHEYLESIGVRETKGGVFNHMQLTLLKDPKAWAAVQYLCEEWDYACQ